MTRADRWMSLDAERSFAADICARMLVASTFDAKWVAINETLQELGATAVNVGAIDRVDAAPFWFRSSLSARTFSDYVSENFVTSDFIVRHAAGSLEDFVWRTAERSPYEEEEGRNDFGNFVRDSGVRSIVSLSIRLRQTSDVTAITYCSTHAPDEVICPANLLRIKTALRLMLPWIDWPAETNEPGFLPVSRPDLSPREKEALRLLAGGLMSARIAEVMGIAEVTVAKHLAAARVKLAARTRTEAVALALRGRHLEL